MLRTSLDAENEENVSGRIAQNSTQGSITQCTCAVTLMVDHGKDTKILDWLYLWSSDIGVDIVSTEIVNSLLKKKISKRKEGRK